MNAKATHHGSGVSTGSPEPTMPPYGRFRSTASQGTRLRVSGSRSQRTRNQLLVADHIKEGILANYATRVRDVPSSVLVYAEFTYRNTKNWSAFRAVITALESEWLRTRRFADHLVRYTRSAKPVKAQLFFDEVSIYRLHSDLFWVPTEVLNDCLDAYAR